MNKVVLLVLPIVLAVGVAGGVVYTGIVNVPGITPKKKFKVVAATKDQRGGFLWTTTAPLSNLFKQVSTLPKVPLKAPTIPAAKKNPERPEEGEKRLAALWSNVDPAKLPDVVQKWNDDEVARILNHMDDEQVAQLLSTLDPKRAASISKAIEKEASKPLPDPVG